jgi:tRNA(fMet)-specific endonuclease VapC
VGILLDTSVFIDYERGALDLEEVVRGREDAEAYLSVVTASELLHGVHRAGDPSRRARRSAFVEAVLAELPVLPIDILVARTHARLWAELAEAGQLIGAHDLWLAATCVGRGLSLATGNARDFDRVPGLEVEVWGGG